MCRAAFILLLASMVLGGQTQWTYIVNTVAGHYPIGDGGAATEALLEFPESVVANGDGFYIADTLSQRIRYVGAGGTITTLATLDAMPHDLVLDAAGNLYVAATSRIYRISPAGEVTTIAGVGWGDEGDGGPAVEAELGQIDGIARATDGTIYLADSNFHKVRAIDPSGIINTVAGTGVAGYSGDGGPASLALLNRPTGLKLDNVGNLLIGDSSNSAIRRMAPDGTIDTLAGNGQFACAVDGALASNTTLGGPTGIEIDAAGNIYFSDPNCAEVYRIDSTGTIHFVAGSRNSGFSGDGGPATAARLDLPSHISLDSTGRLYIADNQNHRIRRVDDAGNIATVAGSTHFAGDGGPATQALLHWPEDIAVDGQGMLYIADQLNNRIRSVTPGGQINTIAGNGELGHDGDGGPALQAEVLRPSTIGLDPQGNVYFANTSIIRRVTPAGIIDKFAGDTFGNTGDGGPATGATFGFVRGLEGDNAGNVYISDTSNDRVRVVGPGGTVAAFAGTGVRGFSGDGGPAVAAQFAGVGRVAVAPDGSLYIADGGNARVRRVALDGTVSTVAGNGTFGTPIDGAQATAGSIDRPSALAVDADSNLYVAAFNQIYKIDAGGVIRRVAGAGATGFSGDGGAAVDAEFDNITGLAVYQNTVYVADRDNHRVRALSPVVAERIQRGAGNDQNGLLGQPTTVPLQVRVFGPSDTPIAGFPIAYEVVAGDATLPSATAFTDANGVAGLNPILGNATGDVTLRATAQGIGAIDFLVHAVQDPAGIAAMPILGAGGVVGAGLSIPPVRTVSPLGIVSVFGADFAAPGTFRQVGPDDLVNGWLPTNLDNLCVAFGNQLGYVLHIFGNQINVQVPTLPLDQTVDVQVVRNCGLPEEVRSNVESVLVEIAAPEFIYWVQNLDGVNPIAAVNPVTGEFIGLPDTIPGVEFVSARPGDIIDLYATGFGPANPAIAPGEIPAQLASLALQVEVSIGGVQLAPEDVLYVGATQWAGVYLVRIRVPSLPGPGPQGSNPRRIMTGSLPPGAVSVQVALVYNLLQLKTSLTAYIAGLP